MPRRRRTTPAAAEATVPFEPRLPALAATACCSLWIAALSIPMLSGGFLATPYNDQYSSGYAYRAWAAAWWKQLGHVPLWNPEIFGGMPFVAGMHGDVLYPTAWLRLVLPTHIAMNLGFVVHYVLAGLFTYLFLRRWRVSWTGAVVGGLAYELAGVVGSYVSPGHDGKLFVTAMLPLALLSLTLAVRDRRFEAYGLLALTVGLILLSPHPQMAQYALLAAGLFTLFLVFAEGSIVAGRQRAAALALAATAVIVGVGVSAIQYLPFYAYIPYSPRDASVLHDFAWSAAYAIPWPHLPELVIPRFTGESFNGTYWGPNGLKLHSEYLGLIGVMLAVAGAADRERRRMVLWLGGIGLLFLLIALGSATPFFRLWWEVVPFSKSMRAPGMALFIVAFVTAVLAAFGADRIARGSAPRWGLAAIVVGIVVAVFAAGGAIPAMAASLGAQVEAARGLPQRAAMALAATETIRWSATAAGLLLAAAGALTVARRRGRVNAVVWSVGLVLLVGTDLWLDDRAFWRYSHAQDELFAGDAIKARLASVPRPFRAWNVDVYPGAALMADDIPELYGHHGNEPHAFDVLHERQGSSLTFAQAGNPHLLDLYAVNYLIVPAEGAPDSLPGFRRALSDVATSAGVTATLFEREQPIAYARLVAGAASPTSPEQTPPTVRDPRFPLHRLVLLDSVPGEPRGTVPDSLPPPSAIAVAFDRWEPGAMHMRLSAPADRAGHLLVSENWDPEWMATVDGRSTPVLRGDGALITVPVPAGAREIGLEYAGRAYARGRTVTLLSLLLVALGLAVPVVAHRVRTGLRGSRFSNQ